MVKRLTKQEAMVAMGVSASTLERRIKTGEVQVEIKQDGGRRRVWVLADDNQYDVPTDIQPGRSDDNQVAILNTQLKAALELAEYRGELLRESEARFGQVLEQLNMVTKMLPAPAPVEKQRWSWWPWRRRGDRSAFHM